MDSGTIIITVILIIVALLPFIFTGKQYKRQKKQLVKTLNGLAEQNQVKLSSYEASGSFAIGIDKTKCCLFFARMVKDEVSSRTVLLSEMSRCKLKTSHRLLEEGEKVIDRVELALIPAVSGQPEIVLEMYNSEYDTLTIRRELQIATQWEEIIGGLLKELKPKERKQPSAKQVVPV